MTALPYLTASLPGTGGTLKSTDDDFVVDEEPAYLPSGEGEHVFVRIEKRGVATPDAALRIARALGIKERDIGIAGMKDRNAVTRQWFSLPPPITPEAARALAIPDVTILDAVRHPHKLRTGHVRANRFTLRVRGTAADACARAETILAALAEPPGAPNWYGEQRFGRDGDNAARGRAIVLGEQPRGKDRRMDRLMVSALQSDLFNRWLVARIADGHYAAALDGDLLHKVGGGMFPCTDAALDTARVRGGEVIPTGPMFGVAMRAPADGSPAGLREAQILADAGLAVASFANVRAIAEGTRRDAAIAVRDVSVSTTDGDLVVGFTLPGGAYATAVMREVLK
ncbi:MAG: tRNA pseudouridine(13) synthase TruD [Proteobacteria bacterium]|nr:tRNA pseudouridine(13) synthase TruD [Pseudomonadota bacterium]